VLTDSLSVGAAVHKVSFKICSSLLVGSLIYTAQDDCAYAVVGHSSSGEGRNLSSVPMAVTYVQNALHYIHDYTSEL
jgi:hypothetical protein